MTLERSAGLGVLAVGLLVVSSGCAITDYRGWLNHATDGQAKLWGSEIAFVTGDPAMDGTYAYTVSYDFSGLTAVPATYPKPVKIWTYRNAVSGAFSRDGCVDRSGDDIKNSAGDISGDCDAPVVPSSLGGIENVFKPRWLYEDHFPTCEFTSNLARSWDPFGGTDDHDEEDEEEDGEDEHDGNDEEDAADGSPPAFEVCFDVPAEEVDSRDRTLQQPGPPLEDFGSLDDLFGRIWTGSLDQDYTATLTEIELDGVPHSLAHPVSVALSHNHFRPNRITVDLTGQGGQELIQTLLSRTSDRFPVQLAFSMGGGLRIQQPAGTRVAFNHAELSKLLKPKSIGLTGRARVKARTGGGSPRLGLEN